MNYWAGQADLPDGYEEVRIVSIWAEDDETKLEQGAKQLGQNSDVEVIVAAGGPKPALFAQKATEQNQKAVVFTTVINPVRLGLVKSLKRENPDTNLTGMAGKTSETDVSRLIILNQLLPDKGKIGVAIKLGRPLNKEYFEFLEDAAEAMGVKLEPWEVPEGPLNRADLEKEYKNRFVEPVGALLVTADSFFNNNREVIVDILNFFELPAIYQWREFADVGGLISYGPNIIEAYTSAGAYVGRILKGEKVSEIAIAEPTRKELVINLRTAKALKISVPAKLKDRATVLLPE